MISKTGDPALSQAATRQNLASQYAAGVEEMSWNQVTGRCCEPAHLIYAGQAYPRAVLLVVPGGVTDSACRKTMNWLWDQFPAWR